MASTGQNYPRDAERFGRSRDDDVANVAIVGRFVGEDPKISAERRADERAKEAFEASEKKKQLKEKTKKCKKRFERFELRR